MVTSKQASKASKKEEKEMQKIGAIEYFTAKEVAGMLDRPVKSSVAVLQMADRAGVGRVILNHTVFTKNDIKKLNERPSRGRPVGTGHPIGPRANAVTPTVVTDVAPSVIVADVSPVVDMPQLDLPVDAIFS